MKSLKLELRKVLIYAMESKILYFPRNKWYHEQVHGRGFVALK